MKGDIRLDNLDRINAITATTTMDGGSVETAEENFCRPKVVSAGM